MTREILNWKYADSGALIVMYTEDDQDKIRHFPVQFVMALKDLSDMSIEKILDLTEEQVQLYIITDKLGGDDDD